MGSEWCVTDGVSAFLLCAIKHSCVIRRNLNDHPEKEANDSSVNLVSLSFVVPTEPELSIGRKGLCLQGWKWYVCSTTHRSRQLGMWSSALSLRRETVWNRDTEHLPLALQCSFHPVSSFAFQFLLYHLNTTAAETDVQQRDRKRQAVLEVKHCLLYCHFNLFFLFFLNQGPADIFGVMCREFVCTSWCITNIRRKVTGAPVSCDRLTIAVWESRENVWSTTVLYSS